MTWPCAAAGGKALSQLKAAVNTPIMYPPCKAWLLRAQHCPHIALMTSPAV